MGLISKIIKNGKIESLTNLKYNAGLTKEAHIAELEGKKHLLRICRNKKYARRYLQIYNKFKKYGFFPKLIDRKDNYLLFEFIDGRLGKINEDKKVIYQIGKICAIINKQKASYKFERNFLKKIDQIFKKAIVSRKDRNRIIELYHYLSNKVKLQCCLDAGDVTEDNFMIIKDRVYFVDIEAVKPNIRGYGIIKSFYQWFKKEEEKQAFRKGYNSVSSMKFLTKDYERLCQLIFLIHRIQFKSEKGERKTVKIALKRLGEVLTWSL